MILADKITEERKKNGWSHNSINRAMITHSEPLGRKPNKSKFVISVVF